MKAIGGKGIQNFFRGKFIGLGYNSGLFETNDIQFIS